MTAAPTVSTVLDDALRLAIESRLARARAARNGLGDQGMIGRCKRALSGDPGAVQSFITSIAFERLMPEVRHG